MPDTAQDGVHVIGPDKKHYLFPKGTSPDKIREHFKGSTGTVNELTLSGMKKRGPTEMPTPQRQGVWGSFSEGVGIPQSKREASQAGKDFIKGFPLQPLAQWADRIGDVSKATDLQKKEAMDSMEHGGSKSAGVGKILGAETDFWARGPFGPLGGEAAYDFTNHLMGKEYPEAVGSGLALLTLGFLLKGKPEDYTANKLSYAAKADPMAVKAVVADLDRHAKASGFYNSKRTVGDLHKLVQENSKQYNNEFGQALQPIAGQKVVPTTIADSIRNKITPEMQQTAEGRQMAAQLKNRAVEYDKPWTIQQLDLQRTKATKRLRSYRNAAPSGARAASALDVDTIVNKAVEDGTKEIVYSALDKANGKPQGYFEKLKQRQSSNIELTDALEKQTEKLRTKSGQAKGAPFLERHNIHSYINPENVRPGLSMSNIMGGFTNPEKSANKAVRKAFPKLKGTGTALPRSVTTKNALVYSYPMRTLMLPSHTNTLPPLNDGTDQSQ